MSSQHIFVEHTADIAFDVSADSPEELFIEAAKAWRICVVGDVSGKLLSDRRLDLSAGSLEELLVHFLNELNFLLLNQKWLTIIFNRLIIDRELYSLSADITGFSTDSSIEIKEEVKSVTYHQMQIVKKGNRYSTRVVFDI